jgi:hypothetical protein
VKIHVVQVSLSTGFFKPFKELDVSTELQLEIPKTEKEEVLFFVC